MQSKEPDSPKINVLKSVAKKQIKFDDKEQHDSFLFISQASDMQENFLNSMNKMMKGVKPELLIKQQEEKKIEKDKKEPEVSSHVGLLKVPSSLQPDE